MACSPSITTNNGLKIKEPKEALKAATAKVQEDNRAALDNGSATVSDDTRCFFTKANKDADDVSDSLACGPIRRLGVPDERSWDRYGIDLKQDASGDVTATVGGATEQGVRVNPDLLVGDGKPAAVGDVPKPDAPVAEVENKAVLMSTEAVGDVAFDDLDKPWRLITPAATIEVEATGKPQYLPLQLVKPDGGEESGTAPYYRPKDGQRVLAYKVKVSPPAEKGVPASSGTGDYVEMASSMTLGVANGKQINITDLSDDGSESESGDESSGSGDSWSIACLTGNGGWGMSSASFPCARTETTEAVLMMTVPKDGTVNLRAAVNGSTQSIDLAAGKLTSSVSQVEYQRSSLTAKVGQQLRTSKKMTYKDYAEEKDSATATWTWSIDSVALSAFDPTRGWAPKGKAWLIVSTSDYEESEKDYSTYFESDADPTVRVGSKTYKPDLSGSDEWSSNSTAFAFAVPADVTAGAFELEPSGTFSGGENDVHFTAPKGSVKFKLSK